MEDVEVGHGGGDAVELVQQLRLDIVERLGAHRLGVWGASPFELSQKRIRESFCLIGGSGLPVLQTRKPTDTP